MATNAGGAWIQVCITGKYNYKIKIPRAGRCTRPHGITFETNGNFGKSALKIYNAYLQVLEWLHR